MLTDTPTYTPGEVELCNKLGGKEASAGWVKLPDSRIVVPEALSQDLITQVHQSTHLRGTKLIELLKRNYYIPGPQRMAKQVSARCHICAQVNPGPSKEIQQGTRLCGQTPGEHWELDFTEVSPGTFRFKYLLVFIDTFSGWTEAFPTKQETTQIVAKKLVSEIVPRFGLPIKLGSDNDPAFISQTSQSLAKVLGINWKLHCIL